MSDNNGAAEMTNETNAVSTKRLREIAHAIADGNANELTMRVPAEPGRDADLVVMSAADELDRLREERDAFRASSEIRGAEIARLRGLIAAHVHASNNDDSAGDTFGALAEAVQDAP